MILLRYASGTLKDIASSLWFVDDRCEKDTGQKTNGGRGRKKDRGRKTEALPQGGDCKKTCPAQITGGIQRVKK